ncbi:hypothetical protein CR513_35569, partial [Mucuna pruriens]
MVTYESPYVRGAEIKVATQDDAMQHDAGKHGANDEEPLGQELSPLAWSKANAREEVPLHCEENPIKYSGSLSLDETYLPAIIS